MVGTEPHRGERRSFLQALGAVGGLAATGGVASGAQTGDGLDLSNELVIGLEERGRDESVEREVTDRAPIRAAVAQRNDVLGFFTLGVPTAASDTATETLKDVAESIPGVAYAEANVTYEPQLAPNDPKFGDTYAPAQVNAREAWDTTLGSEDVTIAVVDTGTQYGHPDLSAQFGSQEGRDIVDGDSNPEPGGWFFFDEIHGTHVSGLASATTDNGVGVTGVSNSRLLSVRVVDEYGSGSLANVADGIQWATDNGADVINLSLGGGESETLKEAVSYAAENDVLPIAAAGNDGGAVSYPAAFEEVVAVSALDQNEQLADFSNRGPDVDVAAPGVNVLSTYPEDEYKALSGTSMACPVAAGVAALGLANDHDLSATELKQRLKDTARDVGLPSDAQGAGVVDAAAMVAAGDGSTGGSSGGSTGSDGGSDGGSNDGSTDDGGLTWWERFFSW